MFGDRLDGRQDSFTFKSQKDGQLLCLRHPPRHPKNLPPLDLELDDHDLMSQLLPEAASRDSLYLFLLLLAFSIPTSAFRLNPVKQIYTQRQLLLDSSFLSPHRAFLSPDADTAMTVSGGARPRH